MEDFDEVMEGIGAAVGAMIGVVIILSLIALALAIVTLIAKYKAYQKAGQPAYTSLIPYVDDFIMGELSGAKKDTMILLLLEVFGWLISMVPFVGSLAYAVILIVFLCKQRNAVAKSFGYDVGMTALLVLLPTIAWIILGFGSCSYVGPSVTETVATAAPTESSES